MLSTGIKDRRAGGLPSISIQAAWVTRARPAASHSSLVAESWRLNCDSACDLDPLRIDPMILFREKRRDHRAEIFRETCPA